MSKGTEDPASTDDGGSAQWSNGFKSNPWYRASVDQQDARSDVVLVGVDVFGVSVESSGFAPAEVILVLEAAADALTALSRRSAGRTQQGQVPRAYLVDQPDGPLIDGEDKLGTHYIIVRRTQDGGIDVDITGSCLVVAAPAVEGAYRRLRDDQPMVRVVSGGKLVGRHRTGTKR